VVRHGDDRERVVQSVTSAPISGADDQSQRVRRYLLTMGIRVVCGALALFTEGWLRWTFVTLAVVLPYIAVVMANAVGPRSGEAVAPVEHQPPAALPEAPDESDRTIHGRVVDS
jgi:hypothetical protein